MSSFFVQVIPSATPNCFGYLSSTNNFPSDASNSFGVFCLTSPSDGKISVVVQVFGSRSPFAYLHLNASFMKLHEIKEFDQVMLHNVNNVHFCNAIEIMPASLDDWNIIENTAFVIEEVFLDQIRVVRKDMRFVLNVFDNLSVNFRVSAIFPESVGDAPALVSTTTQVLVVPWEEKKDPRKKHKNVDYDFTNARVTRSTSIDDFVDDVKEESYRVLPDSLLSEIMRTRITSLPIVIVKDDEPYSKPKIVSVQSPPIESSCFAVKISSLKDISEDYDRIQQILEKKPHHCWISQIVKELGAKEFTSVKIKPASRSNLVAIADIIVEVYDFDEDNQQSLVESLRNLFNSMPVYTPIVMSCHGLSQAVPVNVNSQAKNVQTIIRPNLEKIPTLYSEKSCFYFWPNNIKIKFEFLTSPTSSTLKRPTPDSKRSSNSDENFGFKPSSYTRLAYQEEISTKIQKDLIPRFENKFVDNRILIIGSKSSGKTAIMTKLARQMFDHELTVFSVYVNLAEWKGKTDSIDKMLNEKIQMLKQRRLSMLFLDNLDFLNVHLDDEERKKFVEKVYRKMARLFLSYNDICIVGSSTTLRHLPESMISYDGFRIWPTIVEIPILEEDTLHDTLNQLLHCNVTFELKRAESYTVGELAKLAERIRLYASSNKSLLLIRSSRCLPPLVSGITSDDVVEVLKNLPTAGRKIQTQVDEQKVTFSDVGGMREVKQKLVEVVIWPSKYAELYTRCGIKARNNAILHGPSGCGKSLIMRAIANEAGLSVITVKGPELLSKYIGSSEENVRKIFERAKNSRPCLVIFDEFDALAPKRGHDNTGVTDRVVNQLLTELDGVDSSLDGIYVLAATNRIDLIDAALLRPGRFDHKIFCDFPNQDERYEILVTLCSEITLASDVDLHKISEMTQSCTGAELRGLVMNAQFAALESRPVDVIEDEEENVTLTWSDFEKVLTSTKKKSSTRKNKPQQQRPTGSKVTLA